MVVDVTTTRPLFRKLEQAAEGQPSGVVSAGAALPKAMSSPQGGLLPVTDGAGGQGPEPLVTTGHNPEGHSS